MNLHPGISLGFIRGGLLSDSVNVETHGNPRHWKAVEKSPKTLIHALGVFVKLNPDIARPIPAGASTTADASLSTNPAPERHGDSIRAGGGGLSGGSDAG